LSNASIERELMHAKAVRSELEAKLREKEVAVERLERDRRWLADREKEESVARENAEREGEEEKVSYPSHTATTSCGSFVSEKPRRKSALYG
jgi:mitotic spindle assembly checkpoint protein MAD1